MFYIPYWTMVLVFLSLEIFAILIHKITFVDILVIVMVIALSLASDMLICKQFMFYHIVSKQYTGWYSFWSGILVYPSIAVTFLKFAPRSKIAVAFYIIFCTSALTLFEIFIVVPYKISIYMKWDILPWSPISYLLAFTAIYLYHLYLEKRITTKRSF